MKVLREVAGGNADVPAARAPFRELVIGERARGHGVDGLAAVLALLDQSSNISVLPAPVGAWTTTSSPARNAATACCCQRSGTATWLSAGWEASWSANIDTESR